MSRELEEKLLTRLVAGEISQEEYDQLLKRVQQHESSSSRLPTQPGSRSVSPAGGRSGFDSVGELPTGALGSSQLAAKQVIGKFQLTERLGRGGMGEVWKARDTIGERDVVIKVLPPELAGNPDELARVKESFKRIHSLNHENICPTYDLGHDANVGYFLVMKYLAARTVGSYRRAIIKKFGNFPLKTTVAILRKIAAALDYSHENKVIHRDIKPDNVMITSNGKQIWLIDFGLAAEIRSSLARVSQVQMDQSGTYPYMAPEQWRGQLQDARTDQYALAVVAYELITGRLPFEGDRFILERCILNEPFPMIQSESDALNQSLARATAKNREERFDCCTSFVEALTSRKDAPTSTPGTKDVARLHAIDPSDDDSPRVLKCVKHYGVYDSLRISPPSEPAVDDAERYLKLAKKGDVEAQFRIGELMFNFELELDDPSIAVRWFREAAERDMTMGLFLLGRAYFGGTGVEKDDESALDWLQKAANKGHPQSCRFLGLLFECSHGVSNCQNTAFKWYYTGAKRCDAYSQLQIANSYLERNGSRFQPKKALHWFRKCAEQNFDLVSAEAQFRIGEMYYEGIGLPQNFEKAAKWYRKAAEAGHDNAQYSLGQLHDQGVLVNESFAESVHWLTKAAEQNHVEAQNQLGIRYWVGGDGIPADKAKAIDWYRKAAENYHEGAAEELRKLDLQ